MCERQFRYFLQRIIVHTTDFIFALWFRSKDMSFTSDTVIHQNKASTPRPNLLEKGSYFDFMIFLGDVSRPSRLGFPKKLHYFGPK